MQARAEGWFRETCQNNSGSGCGGDQVESQNFEQTLYFLRSQKCYVRVFASASQKDFRSGDVSGGWHLGDSGGRCLGGVVWYVAEKHAMRLKRGWEGFCN